MAQHINYLGQIKNEKQLKIIIKETIQHTNKKQLNKIQKILKEETTQKSSFEFDKAFSEIGKNYVTDKTAQEDIVKKNNITLFVLFHLFDDSLNNIWEQLYSLLSLNAESQNTYKDRNKEDVLKSLKAWIESIKKVQNISEFNNATKKLKSDIDNKFFYWEPLLIIGKNINIFNKEIRDQLFKDLNGQEGAWTQVGNITHPSVAGDKKILDLLKNTKFFSQNKLTDEEKKEIWQDKVESGWSLFGDDSSDSTGIWSFIKGLLNSAAVFFLGDDYKDVADDLFKGLGKFENMLQNNPDSAAELLNNLFSLGDQKAGKEITSQQFAKKAINLITGSQENAEIFMTDFTNHATTVVENQEKKTDATGSASEIKKSDTAQQDSTNSSSSSSSLNQDITGAISNLQKTVLIQLNIDDIEKVDDHDQQAVRAKVHEGIDADLLIKNNNVDFITIQDFIIEKNIKLYLIYSLFNDEIVSSLKEFYDDFFQKNQLPTQTHPNFKISRFYNYVKTINDTQKSSIQKIYDNLYNITCNSSRKDRDLLVFCDDLNKLSQKFEEIFNGFSGIFNGDKSNNDFFKNIKSIIMSTDLDQDDVWKKSEVMSRGGNPYNRRQRIGLFKKDRWDNGLETAVDIKGMIICISDWDKIKEKILKYIKDEIQKMSSNQITKK